MAQIEALWIAQGGSPGWAPLMAGIALAESNGDTTALNTDANTGDYSVGLWQINYFGNLLASRTKQYGSPSSLQASPDNQAKAAITLFGNGAGASNWQNDPTYNQWKAAGFPSQPTTAQVQQYLANARISPNGTSGGASDATASNTSANGVNGNSVDLSKCVINVPVVGCLLKASELKALKGGLLMIAGGGTMALGAIILTAFTFSNTAAGRAAKGAVNATPIGGAIKGLRSSGGSPKWDPDDDGPDDTTVPAEIDGTPLDADERAAFRAGGAPNVRKFRQATAA